MRSHLLILASAAILAPQPFSPVLANDQQAATADRVVCKHRKKTGTRFTSKICKRVSDWEKSAEQSRADLKEMVDRPHVLICGPGGCG